MEPYALLHIEQQYPVVLVLLRVIVIETQKHATARPYSCRAGMPARLPASATAVYL